MKYLVAVTGIFLAIAFAGGLSPYVRVLGVAPDAMLIFVACWAALRGEREAMLLVPAAGLLKDLATTDPVGTSILALSPIVFLLMLRELRPAESDFVPALLIVSAASLAYGLITMAVLAAAGDGVPFVPSLLRVVLPSMLVNPLFASVVYPLLKRLNPAPRRQHFGVGSAVQL